MNSEHVGSSQGRNMVPNDTHLQPSPSRPNLVLDGDIFPSLHPHVGLDSLALTIPMPIISSGPTRQVDPLQPPHTLSSQTSYFPPSSQANLLQTAPPHTQHRPPREAHLQLPHFDASDLNQNQAGPSRLAFQMPQPTITQLSFSPQPNLALAPWHAFGGDWRVHRPRRDVQPSAQGSRDPQPHRSPFNFVPFLNDGQLPPLPFPLLPHSLEVDRGNPYQPLPHVSQPSGSGSTTELSRGSLPTERAAVAAGWEDHSLPPGNGRLSGWTEEQEERSMSADRPSAARLRNLNLHPFRRPQPQQQQQRNNSETRRRQNSRHPCPECGSEFARSQELNVSVSSRLSQSLFVADNVHVFLFSSETPPVTAL